MSILTTIGNICGIQILRKSSFIYHSTAPRLYQETISNFPESPFIVDVGANIGQTVTAYLDAFPRSSIIAYEPDPSNFSQLAASYKDNPQVQCKNLALGSATEASAPLHLSPHTTEHSLIPQKTQRNSGETVSIEITTLDIDLGQERQKIDILKTDTEGFESEVFTGASQLLESGRIRSIVAEVGFGNNSPWNHVPLRDIEDQLSRHNFYFVGIYDLAYISGRLLYANALFVHRSAAVD